MIRLNVPKMSCGHCTAAIDRVIDPTVKVACDLGTHTVEVGRFTERADLVRSSPLCRL